MKKIYNHNSQLLSINRENCEDKYLNDLLVSLTNVDSKYLLWPYGDVDEQMCERVFAYELYHQWRIISEIFQYDNLIINGEIRKDGSVYRRNINIVYPDLVLHEQQNNLNQQLLACEIKTIIAIKKSLEDFKKDLIKLSNYIDVLEYKTCVFIQIMDDPEIFERNILYLKDYKDQIPNLSKIYYVIKDYEYISFETLENLLAE